MNKKNNNTYILLFAIIILLLVIIYLLTKKNNNEYFESINSETPIGSLIINYQVGKGNVTPTGTITFTTPFLKLPSVFTQITCDPADSANSYTIQVYNITNNSFDYSKNKIYNTETTAETDSSGSSTYSSTSMVPSTTEPFIWLAIG